MRRTEFKKHLDQLNEEDLKEELLTLFTKLKSVKQYYLMELGGDSDRQKIYKKAKEDIASKYATKSYRKPRRPRIQKINTLLKKLRSEAVLPYEMIDIYLFNTETALNFMVEYRFDSNPLRNSIKGSFSKALDLIQLENMKAEYKDRCGTITNKMNFAFWVFEESIEKYKDVFRDS